MSMPIAESGTPVVVTGTGAVNTCPCLLIGFYVSSTSSGTLALKSGGSSGDTISGTITPAIGFHKFPAEIKNGGLYATVGGTISATFFFVGSGYAV